MVFFHKCILCVKSRIRISKKDKDKKVFSAEAEYSARKVQLLNALLSNGLNSHAISSLYEYKHDKNCIFVMHFSVN